MNSTVTSTNGRRTRYFEAYFMSHPPFAMHQFSRWVFIRSYWRWAWLALPIHLALDELVESTIMVPMHYMPGVFTDLVSTYSSIQRP